jgi:hypothetical protein
LLAANEDKYRLDNEIGTLPVSERLSIRTLRRRAMIVDQNIPVAVWYGLFQIGNHDWISSDRKCALTSKMLTISAQHFYDDSSIKLPDRVLPDEGWLIHSILQPCAYDIHQDPHSRFYSERDGGC